MVRYLNTIPEDYNDFLTVAISILEVNSELSNYKSTMSTWNNISVTKAYFLKYPQMTFKIPIFGENQMTIFPTSS